MQITGKHEERDLDYKYLPVNKTLRNEGRPDQDSRVYHVCWSGGVAVSVRRKEGKKEGRKEVRKEH